MAARRLAGLVLLLGGSAWGAQTTGRTPPLRAPVEESPWALDAPLAPQGPPTLLEVQYLGKGGWRVSLLDPVPGELGPPLVSLTTADAAPEFSFRHELYPVAPLARFELR